jgi:pre-mRNA-splicing factor ATP-dependent RNA helicase DHX16
LCWCRDAIEDEEYLFEGVKLTEKEQADLDYKKRVYELAKQKTEAVDDAMEVRVPPDWLMEAKPVPNQT